MGRGPHCILAASIALFATVAMSQAPDPHSAIQARQIRFREIGGAFKAIKDELGRPTPGKFAMSSSAKQIADDLRGVRGLFPPGSGTEAGIKTAAKPAIWTDHATFDRLNQAAIADADKLVVAMRGTDMDAVRAQTGALGADCKACHEQFRNDE